MFPQVLLERSHRLGESYYKQYEQIMLRTPKCDKVNLNDFSDNEKSRSPTADILGQVNVMNALSTGCEMLDRHVSVGNV